MKKKYLYLWTLPLLALILYINYSLDALTRQPLVSQPGSAASSPSENSRSPAFSEKAASEASRYGIETQTPHSEMEWSQAMDKMMAKPAVMTSMNQQGLLDDLRNNPQKIREKLQ